MTDIQEKIFDMKLEGNLTEIGMAIQLGVSESTITYQWKKVRQKILKGYPVLLAISKNGSKAMDYAGGAGHSRIRDLLSKRHISRDGGQGVPCGTKRKGKRLPHRHAGMRQKHRGHRACQST